MRRGIAGFTLNNTIRPTRFFHTFGPHEPFLRVQPGSVLRLECPDSDNMFADGTLVPESHRSPTTGSAIFPGNPMAGPIHVEGAMPGDVLAVRIRVIHLTATHGQTLLKPGHGLLAMHELAPDSPDSIPTHMYRWRVDAANGVSRLKNPLGSQPIEVALDPFLGCLGVCPKWGQSVSTLFAGSFGGNMDIPLLRPGATLFLPVEIEGALFGLGDIHAAQGHGEIIGGAIETAGEVEVQLDVIKNIRISSPRLRSPAVLAAISSDGDLNKSIRNATSQLVQWLHDGFGLNRFDAYNVVSQAGSFVLGSLICGTPSVAACIELEKLPKALQASGGELQ